MKKITKYNVVEKYEYKNGCFSAGLCKNSKHKANDIYLQIMDNVFELRKDEVYAILSALTLSLWVEYQGRSRKTKNKPKWIKKEKLP